MKVEDLGISGNRLANPSTTSSDATSPIRLRLFYFISLYQIESQKIWILSFLAILFLFLQNSFISFWPHLNLCTKLKNEKYDFLRKPPIYEENLTNVFFFYSTDKEPDDLYLISFLIILISFFVFFVSLTCFILFFSKGVINFQLLMCFNFFVHFLCPLIIVPLGFQIGHLIMKLTQMKEYEEVPESLGSISVFTSILVLDIILYLIAALVIIANNFYCANSIIVVKSFFVCFSGLFQSFLMIFPSFILLFSNILPLFHSNTRYLIVSIHLLFCLSMIIGCFWIPFGKISLNSIVSSVHVSMIISDVICFTEFNLRWERYLIFIGLFVALYFVFNILLKVRINHILRKNSRKDQTKDEKLRDEDASPKNMILQSNKFKLFGDPEVEETGFEDLSISSQLFVLRVGLIVNSSVFYNGKLIDLLTTKVESDQDKIRLSSLICYFPDFSTVFFAFLTRLRHIQFLPFLYDFQFYQLILFDNGTHTDHKINELQPLIKETVSLSTHIRSFWQVIDSECNTFNDENSSKKFKLKTNLFSIFDPLSRSILNCHNKWKVLISFYPNNVQALEEYSKFLIECNADFIKAAELKTVSKLIQEGKVYKYNPIIISFLRAYPFYYKQILGKKSAMKNFDDIDNHSKIENIPVEMPEVRFEYQLSVNSSYPFSIVIYMFISIISMLFIIIFWVYGSYSFGHFEHITESLYYITNVAFLAQQISKNIISAILDYGQLPEIDIVPSPQEIKDTIYLNNQSDRVDTSPPRSLIPIIGEYKSSLSAVSERGMGLINYLHNATLEQIEKGNKFQVVLDVFYSNTSSALYYISKNRSVEFSTNLQSLLISFYTYYFTMSYDHNYSYINDTNCYHATFAGALVLDQLDLISKSILQNNDILLEDVESFYTTGLFSISISYFIISVIFTWVDFAFIAYRFKNICNTFCYFPKEVRCKASNWLIKSNDKNNEEDEIAIKNFSSKIKNSLIVFLIISTIINLFLTSTVIVFHFIYEKHKNNFINIAFLDHYYSLETSQVIETLYSVMAANTFGRVIPSVDAKYKQRLTTTVNKFIKTHQESLKISVESDCGVTDLNGQEIQKIQNLETCPDYPDKTFHELISCFNGESMANVFLDLTFKLQSNIEDPYLMKKDDFKHYIHFVLSHFYYSIRMFGNYLIFGTLVKQQNYIELISIFEAVSIVVSCLLFIYNIFIYLKIRRIFKLLFIFISRVLPSDLVSNNKLLYYLFGIKNTNKNNIDDTGKSFIIQESSSPIIFIDRSALIEFVNKTFSNSFGYDSDFIVGQPISTLIEDESVITYLDTLKFFKYKETTTKTAKCIKGNGNKALFDITFIPISSNSNKKKKKKEKDFDSDSDDESKFIHRIALIFYDKTTEIKLKKRCQSIKETTENIIKSIYPNCFQMYIQGYLKVCSICLIKFSNSYNRSVSPNKILFQRQSFYKMLNEKLSIFPLLMPLDMKNGIFAAIGCKKNDPTELAIECLNYVFAIIDDFNKLMTQQAAGLAPGLIMNGPMFAVVETGGELIVGWSGENSKKAMFTGELIERALDVLDNAPLAGSVCVSKKTYEYLMMNNYSFTQKTISEKICGVDYVYEIENNNNNESIYASDKTGNGINESFSFDNFKEDETVQAPNDE